MEHICNVLKDFLVNDLGSYLSQLADSDTPLPSFTDKSVIVGTVDIESYKYGQTAFIIPDFQSVADLSLDSEEERTTVEIYMFVRNAKADVLFRQAMRYALAVKKAVKDNWSIDGNFTQASVTAIDYYDDVESDSKSIRAVKVSMTITNEI